MTKIYAVRIQSFENIHWWLHFLLFQNFYGYIEKEFFQKLVLSIALFYENFRKRFFAGNCIYVFIFMHLFNIYLKLTEKSDANYNVST